MGTNLARRLSLVFALSVLVGMIWIASGVLGLGGATPIGSTELIAKVNEDEISRVSFDTYAAVLTDPNGVLRTSRDQVLLSLVNQRLVAREAKRLGVVIADSEIEEALEEWRKLDIAPSSLARSGGIDGLRNRIRGFLELSRVKAIVVGDIVVDDIQVRDEHSSDLTLRTLPLDQEVATTIRMRVTQRETERRWSTWLSHQRECSTITVYDRTFSLASSSPRPGCH